MNLDRPRELLTRLIAEHDTDLATVSKAIQRNHAYLQQYLTRGSPRDLPEDVRERLGEHFGVSPDEFRPKAETGERRAPTKPATKPNMLTIDELDVRAGNADGGQIHPSDGHDKHETVVTQWTLPANVVRAVTSAAAERIKIITAVGDSNKPEILPGERVMVDTSDTTPSPPGFFALWDGFGQIIKRLEMIPYSDPPRVIVRSANPAYETRELLLAECVINGRVLGKWLWT